jgi:lipopolysaccharide export system protein LptA
LKNLFFLLLYFTNSFFCIAQTTTIQILDNTKIQVNNKDSFKYVLGNPAIIKQGNTLFKADSIYISDKMPFRFIEAFGNVYINESDSVVTNAGYLKYLTDSKLATLKNNVSIRSKGGLFTTNDVDYDLNTKLATYKTGGKIVSKKSILTSKTGQYYANSKDALFTNNVVLNGPEYDINTDTLYFNSETEIANFVSFTKVVNHKKKQTIETTRGYYDMKRGKASFSERSIFKENGRTIKADKMDMDETNKTYVLQGSASIVEENRIVEGEYIDINEKEEKYKVQGNGLIIDKEKQETFRGQLIELNKKTELYHLEGNALYKNEKEGIVITGNTINGDGKLGRFLSTGKPVAIIKQENDSIYIAADTLYSGRIINKEKIKTDSITKSTSIDTLNKKNSSDTLRYFEAFHHVRIFSDSVQAVCDSMYYSDVDSVFRLYYDPIVWNDKSQITGDTMYLFSKNKKMEKVEVFEKAFVINTVQPNKFYNQIKANKITGYFKEGNIDSLYSKGSAEIIFYIQDEDKAYIGVDKSSANIIISYFENKEIYKIKWLNKYDATTIPMKDVSPEALRLKGFTIQENKRPKTKFELFF